jgi:hypothetical protein
MAALLDVPGWAAEAKDEKVAETLFGAGQIGGRIHGTEHGVGGHLAIESSNETFEAGFADERVDFAVFHKPMLTRSG